MRVHVDQTKCEGVATCAFLAPDVFDLDDFGYAAALNDGFVPVALEPKVRQAIADCPVQAIRELTAVTGG
jgi:ferredoxin